MKRGGPDAYDFPRVLLRNKNHYGKIFVAPMGVRSQLDISLVGGWFPPAC